MKSALLFLLAALAVSTAAAPLSVNELDLAQQLRSYNASCEQCMEVMIEIERVHGIYYCVKHGFCPDTPRPDAAATLVNVSVVRVCDAPLRAPVARVPHRFSDTTAPAPS